LQWIGTAVKQKAIDIPDEGSSVDWKSLNTRTLG